MKLIFLLCFSLLLNISVYASCEAYFEELNHKIRARTVDQSLSTDLSQKNFLDHFEKLSKEDKDLVLEKLLDLSSKDLKLADDFTKLLNKGLESNILTLTQVEKLLSKNDNGILLFDFKKIEDGVTYQLNISSRQIEILDAGLAKLNLDKTAANDLRFQLMSMTLSEENLVLILEKIEASGLHQNKMEILESYLHFMKSKSASLQKQAILELPIVSNAGESSALIKEFRKNLKRFDNYEAQMIELNLKEANKKFPEKTKIERWDYARFKANGQKKVYEHLSNGCRGNIQTPEGKLAAKKFAKFRLLMGTVNTVGMYTYFNWDKEKDMSWFGKLGYEIGVSMIMSWINSKIITNPGSTYLQKGLMNYGSYAVSDIATAFGYTQFFGTTDKEIQQRFEELKKDPEFEQKIKELFKFLEEQKVDQNFLEAFNRNFTDKTFDPEKLTPEDLNSPEIRDVLMETMSAQLYEENAGEHLQTGSVGVDRYSFARLYGLYAVPKGIAVNLWIYRILCMSTLNPQAAYLKAGLIYMTDSLTNNAIYYKFRRDAINQ